MSYLFFFFYVKKHMMELREQFSISEFDFYYFMLYILLFVLFWIGSILDYVPELAM